MLLTSSAYALWFKLEREDGGDHHSPSTPPPHQHYSLEDFFFLFWWETSLTSQWQPLCQAFTTALIHLEPLERRWDSAIRAAQKGGDSAGLLRARPPPDHLSSARSGRLRSVADLRPQAERNLRSALIKIVASFVCCSPWGFLALPVATLLLLWFLRGKSQGALGHCFVLYAHTTHHLQFRVP